MDVVTAAGSERIPQPRSSLLGVLLVATALAFITALIVLSGEPSPAWLLYLLPIVLAALSHEVQGGVVASVLAGIALAAVVPPQFLAEHSSELIVGFTVFGACGIVLGFQARRQRSHGLALEHASVFDTLTGVLRAEPFSARLGEELRRGDRYGHPVGLVFVRVEGFDEFSRVFGHFKAESMLCHLADIIRLSARDTDVIGRLETSAFGVILPHTSAQEARAAASRVVLATSSAEFEGDALEPVTACITVAASASYPEDASTAAGLLDAARTACGSSPEAHPEGRDRTALVPS